MARRTLRDGNVDSNQSNQEGADAGAEAITQREQDTSTGTNKTKKQYYDKGKKGQERSEEPLASFEVAYI